MDVVARTDPDIQIDVWIKCLLLQLARTADDHVVSVSF
jgi:hypothetical protein